MPVLLGGGVLLAVDAPRTRLRLTGTDATASGIVNLQYDIAYMSISDDR
jgi:hypothetical protein